MNTHTIHTILVVEDVDEIRTRMHDMLILRGHKVLHATNANDAIQMTEAHRPSMILTELELPTFAELMKLLREHRDFGNMVVAILDGNHPRVSDNTVNVLRDFDELDSLLASLPPEP